MLGSHSQTGAHHRQADKCLGLDKSADDPHVFQAPGYDEFDASRSVHDIPIDPPREALHNKLRETPQVFGRFATARLKTTIRRFEANTARAPSSHHKPFASRMYVVCTEMSVPEKIPGSNKRDVRSKAFSETRESQRRRAQSTG